LSADILEFPGARAGFQLTRGQHEALSLIFRAARGKLGERYAVIAGFAGTGKTSLLAELASLNPWLLSPTNKAAARLREKTGLPAQTLHSALYVPPKETKSGDLQFRLRGMFEPPFECKVIVVDEASMVARQQWEDLLLAAHFLKLPVIAVGDAFQLAPVDPWAQIPFSVMALGQLGRNRVELTEVVRQAQDNPIISASMLVRSGRCAEALMRLQAVQPKGFAQAAAETVRAGGVVISYTNKARHKTNSIVRAQLGHRSPMPQPGEPLVLTRNVGDLGLFNGELVTFDGWHRLPMVRCFGNAAKQKTTAQTVGTATLAGDRKAWVCLDAFLELEGHHAMRWWPPWLEQKLGLIESVPLVLANYGYCLTAHKAQGSEWPSVLVLVEPQARLHTVEGQRWFYTAITRASRSAAVYLGAAGAAGRVQ